MPLKRTLCDLADSKQRQFKILILESRIFHDGMTYLGMLGKNLCQKCAEWGVKELSWAEPGRRAGHKEPVGEGGGWTFRGNATERGGLKERFSVGIDTWGLGTDARGRRKSRGCGSDFKLHAVFRENRNVAQGGNEDAVTCWETRSYSWRIHEPLLLYDENIWWVHNDLLAETNRQTQPRAKQDHKILTTSLLHYDTLECEWAFKAVITLATCGCVQPAFRSMWATFLTCGTLERVISH